MAKIPFEIKFKPQIESGEYKVETRDGKPARIICWDKKEYEDQREQPTPIVYLITSKGGCEHIMSCTTAGMYSDGLERDSDLFIVTPDPELSEFEERIFKLLRQYKECDISLTPENIKAEASMLWPDFEKYFFDLYGKEGDGDSALRSFYYRGLADGKSEALKDLPRWERSKKPPFLSTEVKNYALEGYDTELWLLHSGRKINIKSLEKLPGFKEDDK